MRFGLQDVERLDREIGDEDALQVFSGLRRGLARLRQECVQAKEALSSDSEATIAVFLPTLQTQVRLTRAEFARLQ